jgi:hypothetical protein
MNVSLTQSESAVIRKALMSYLKELRGEIVDTDNPQYKRELREERAELEAAVEKLDRASQMAPDGTAVRLVEMWWSTAEL